MNASLDREMVCKLLGIPKSSDLRYLVYTAFKQSRMLPIALSVAMLERKEMFGSVTREIMAVFERRQDEYLTILREVENELEAKVLKGPNISAYYPQGILRGFSDLDLVAINESEIWKIVEFIKKRKNVSSISFNICGKARPRILVCVRWVPSDPLFEKERRIEVSNGPFFGNFEDVPIRHGWPDNGWIANLLSIAEERFQQPFRARDYLDVAMMIDHVPNEALVLEEIEKFKLAPEVLELLKNTFEIFKIEKLDSLSNKLKTLSKIEIEHRAKRKVPNFSESNVKYRLENCLPVHGLPLDIQISNTNGNISNYIYLDHGIVAATPVGSYLLTGTKHVSEKVVNSVLTDLKNIGGEVE